MKEGRKLLLELACMAFSLASFWFVSFLSSHYTTWRIGRKEEEEEEAFIDLPKLPPAERESETHTHFGDLLVCDSLKVIEARIADHNCRKILYQLAKNYIHMV